MDSVNKNIVIPQKRIHSIEMATIYTYRVNDDLPQ